MLYKELDLGYKKKNYINSEYKVKMYTITSYTSLLTISGVTSCKYPEYLALVVGRNSANHFSLLQLMEQSLLTIYLVFPRFQW